MNANALMMSCIAARQNNHGAGSPLTTRHHHERQRRQPTVLGLDALTPPQPPPLFDPIKPETGWSAQRLLSSTFKNLGTPPQVGKRFLDILLSSPKFLCAQLELLQTQPGPTKDFSLEVDAFELISRDPVLGNMLLRFPATLLPLLEDAIVEAQRVIKTKTESNIIVGCNTSNDVGHTNSSLPRLLVKGEGVTSGLTRIHARLTHLPPHISCCKPSIASLCASDTNKIVQVAGTVVKTSGVQMYESTRSYKCTDKKCGASFCVYADLEQHNNALPMPKLCPGTGGADGGPCRCNKFEILEGQSVHTDYQEVKIQESGGWSGGTAGSRVGSIPRSLLIKLQHDLVDRCQPGDEIVAVGSLISQWQPVTGSLSCDVGLALNAHSIRIINAEDHTTWDSAGGVGVGSSSRGKGAAVKDELRREFDELWESDGAKTHPIAIRNMICRSVCPRLYGMSTIKLALLITLIGGASAECTQSDGLTPTGTQQKDDQNMDEDDANDEPEQFQISFASTSTSPTQQDYGYGQASQQHTQLTPKPAGGRRKSRSVQTRRREQSHLLLVGDPGTGKSQFLRFAAALCPRSVLTTGTGTTSAGLTCAAVREGKRGEYGLEAGALVLADKGVCCIDEFGCIRDEERTSIHEAMEQQTLSVAKAGIVCKLNCRATVIAVTNAKGGLYDHDKTLTQNTGIDPPLMSRFDLVFRLIDDSDLERDKNIATFLLNNAIEGFGYECTNQTSNTIDKVWNMEKLRAYIATVKSRFHPSVSAEAAALLERHYRECRSSPSSTITVTVRFLESLIRLSQSHARLMYRHVVTLQDAAAAILLMECSAGVLHGFNPGVRDANEHMLYRDPMATAFPEDSIADIEFLCDQYMLLDRYDMLNYLLDEDQKKVEAYVQKYQQVDDNNEGFNPPSVPGGGDAWSRLENSHGQQRLQQRSTVNEYVTGNFAQYKSQGNEAMEGNDSTSMSQDHYGRASQPSTVKKAPRSNRRSTGQYPSERDTFDADADFVARLERHTQAQTNPSPPPPPYSQGQQQSDKENVSGMWDRINAPATTNAKKRRRRAD